MALETELKRLIKVVALGQCRFDKSISPTIATFQSFRLRADTQDSRL